MRRTVFGLGAAQVLLCTALLGAAAWSLGLPPVAAGSHRLRPVAVLDAAGAADAGRAQPAEDPARARGLRHSAVPGPRGAAGAGGAAAARRRRARRTPSDGAWWLGLLKLLAVIAVVIIGGGRLLLRPALRIVARVRVAEVFTAAALLTVIATALMANLVGLSMSLGRLPRRRAARRQRVPPRARSGSRAVQGTAARTVLHLRGDVGESRAAALGATDPARRSRPRSCSSRSSPSARSARLGRASAPRRRGVWPSPCRPAASSPSCCSHSPHGRSMLDAGRADLLVLAVTLSMMLGPLLLLAHEAIDASLAEPALAPFDAIDERDIPVIIAGFGRFGQIVARVLRVKGIVLHRARQQPDACRLRAPLRQQGLLRRRLAARPAARRRRRDARRSWCWRIDDVEASVRTAVLAREQFPNLKVFARARNRQHAFALMDAGVKVIMRETYGSSLEMAARCWRPSAQTPAVGARGGAPLPRARRGDARGAVRGQGGREQVPRHLASRPRSSWRSCSRPTATDDRSTHG